MASVRKVPQSPAPAPRKAAGTLPFGGGPPPADDDPAEFFCFDLGMGVTAQIVAVDAVIAAEWLTKLGGLQRTVKLLHYRSIVDDMANGRFVFNGQPVIFDATGELIDGQHRLRAIIETGTTQVLLVVRGIATKAYHTVDNGKPKGAGDAFAHMGLPGGRNLAAACTLLWRYEKGELLSNDKVSPSAAVETVLAHPAIAESATYGRRASRACQSRCIPVFCHYLFSSLDPTHRKRVDEFFDRLATGENLSPGSPVLALRRKLADKQSTNDTLFFVFKAWKAYRDNKPMTNLVKGKDEPFPEL